MSATTALRARVPSDILPLVVAVTIGGNLAAFLAATPLLFLTTLLVATGIATAATWEFHSAVGVLARLPDGRARALLDDLLRRAAVVSSSVHSGALVRAACEGARQLSALELHIAAFDAQDGLDHSPRWHEASDHCRRGRDLLTQRLQDASAALSRWQAEHSRSAAESLAELARELNDESRYQHEAAREVNALLGPNS